ncbi:MAG: hypothetical protein WC700_18535 [Gemmatimonadaceae bacterium]|jgi:5-methylcytosine-specific restriction endonuclease McrA
MRDRLVGSMPKAEPWCDHKGKTFPVRRVKAVGTVTLQCHECGAHGETLGWKATGLMRAEFESLRQEDVKASEAWSTRHYSKIHEDNVAKAVAQHDLFQESHDALTRTARWARVREEVLRRANYLCQCCRRARATQVHHTHYFTDAEGRCVGGEQLWSFVALCARCHQPGGGKGWAPCACGETATAKAWAH